jgi:hypothetical protein
MPPSNPTVRDAPPGTLSLNRSMSARVTAATFRPPSSGLMWHDMRLASVVSVDDFLAARRRVRTRPSLAASRYSSHSSATVAALRASCFRPAGSAPPATSTRRRRASARAMSGVQGAPWRPIVCHRWRPAAVRYLRR